MRRTAIVIVSVPRESWRYEYTHALGGAELRWAAREGALKAAYSGACRAQPLP